MLEPGFRVLDERERLILHLRFFEGLTQSQIAQQIGISQMHVSRLIRRSLEKIRDEIAADGLEEPPRRAAPRRAGGSARPGPPTIHPMRTTAELREGFLSFFEEKGHLRCPSASLVPRADDRSTLLTTAGMQPQMPYFLGREAPPAPLTTTCQKVFRTPGHRRGRARHLPPDLLRDARQLLVRPVLQGGRDRLRDRVPPRPAGARLGPDLGERPRRRPRAEARPGPGRDRPLGADRHAARADRAAALVRELLVGRRAGPVRPRLGDLLRLGRRDRLRHARLPAGLLAVRALPRGLEPRLHGVRAAPRRDADAAAEAEHRHRDGARAHGARAAERARRSTTPTATS